MGVRRWWRKQLGKWKREQAVTEVPERRPLREFVYLDEVSLRSLLVSQKSTIPEEVSRAMTVAEEAEIASKASVGMEVVAKTELGGRYQTSNSSTIQTSRKAIVQTLFKELRDEKGLDYALVVRTTPVLRYESLDQIVSSVGPDTAVPASRFKRGALVEIEVTLEVDPIFKFWTLISEFTAMAKEYPEMFGHAEHAGQSMLREAQPINKVLERLLAGLIPIRAKAVNYTVVTEGESEYVVHQDAIAGFDLPSNPLEVVGVTEHLGYWKDIRRVLFSSGRFTMLCRVSRDGLHNTWTPVKLADLFGEVAPTLVDQINAASRAGLGGMYKPTSSTGEAFGRALSIYKEKLVSESGSVLSTVAEQELTLAIAELKAGGSSPSEQRRAFACVRDAISAALNEPLLDDEGDLRARQEARSESGLEFFPTLETQPSNVQPAALELNSQDGRRLLDVEVVAIYW